MEQLQLASGAWRWMDARWKGRGLILPGCEQARSAGDRVPQPGSELPACGEDL